MTTGIEAADLQSPDQGSIRHGRSLGSSRCPSHEANWVNTARQCDDTGLSAVDAETCERADHEHQGRRSVGEPDAGDKHRLRDGPLAPALGAVLKHNEGAGMAMTLQRARLCSALSLTSRPTHRSKIRRPFVGQCSRSAFLWEALETWRITRLRLKPALDVYGRPLCQVLNSRQLEGKDCTRISGLWLQPLGPLSLMGFAG